MKKLYSSAYIACLLIWQFGTSLPPAHAAKTEMEIGVSLFNRHLYAAALNHFVLTVRKNPYDSSALYYEALTYQHMKEFDLAKQKYKIIIQRFPNSAAAQNALLALSYLDPGYYKSTTRTASHPTMRANPTLSQEADSENNASADLASLPSQARIHYHREGQNLVVSTSVNGRPIDMFFDSGAEGVVLRKSELESLGIKPPSGQHATMSYGVGDAGGQKTWIAKVTLKVGPIERKNFAVLVQEDPPGEGGISHPLLGETFFKDFTISYDNAPDGNSGTILFQKKTANQEFAANDSNVIPFTNMGKDILVEASVDGKKMTMIFDTGAESCVFSLPQLQALGISVPDNATQGMNSGIAGTTKSWAFTVDRMQFGSVIKTDVPISAIESSGIPYPLLGNSFLHDLRIDVDNASHKMRIRR